jgi:hypothetical protein
MVEFDCGTCEVTLQPVTPRLHDGRDEPGGAYPSRLLACPRCGASWEQCTTGVLIKI